MNRTYISHSTEHQLVAKVRNFISYDMYKNIFIYLALATAIDGCRGGIRRKRIADSIESDEKKPVGGTSSILADSMPAKVMTGDAEVLLKEHDMNAKRDDLGEDGRIESLAEGLKHQMTAEEKSVTDGLDGGNAKIHKETEDLTAEAGKSELDSMKGDKSDSGKIHEAQQKKKRENFERVAGSFSNMQMITGNKDCSIDEKARYGRTANLPKLGAGRHVRKSTKRDGTELISGGSTSHLETTTDLKSGEKHPDSHAGDGGDEDDSIKKLIADVKLEGHKDLKPDADVFLYGNMPAYYKAPPVVLEMFNSKESMSPASFEHYYPTSKWIQRRSPIQSAFEIANMMFKVGMDDMDSDDYADRMPIFFDKAGPVHKLGGGVDVCPIHAKKVSYNGDFGDLGDGASRFGECVCTFGRNFKDGDKNKVESLERIKRKTQHEQADSGAGHLQLLKPFALL